MLLDKLTPIVLYRKHVCALVCVCVPAKCVYDFVLEPASDSQQCLITALLRNNGLLGFQTSHSAHYFLQLYRLIKLSFFLLQTDSLFPFRNPHFPMHIPLLLTAGTEEAMMAYGLSSLQHRSTQPAKLNKNPLFPSHEWLYLHSSATLLSFLFRHHNP